MIRGIQGRLRAIPLLLVLGVLLFGVSISPAPAMANTLPNSGTPATAPASQALDWAECGVVVEQNGALIRQTTVDSISGNPCATASFQAPECGPPTPFRGCYVVTFTQNVRSCTYLATIGIPGSEGVVFQPSFIDTAGRFDDVNGVFVYTRDTLTSQGSDRPFHLLVSCTLGSPSRILGPPASPTA